MIFLQVFVTLTVFCAYFASMLVAIHFTITLIDPEADNIYKGLAIVAFWVILYFSGLIQIVDCWMLK